LLVNNNKEALSLLLALIEVEILFIFPLKIKRLKRRAGPIFSKMPNLSAPKINYSNFKSSHLYKKTSRCGRSHKYIDYLLMQHPAIAIEW